VSRRPPIRDYLEALLVAALFGIAARVFVLQALRIPSASMETSLHAGDHVLVNKFVFASASNLERALLPQRVVRAGDVIAFRYPEDPVLSFVKRCVASGTDHLQIIGGGLVVNGRRVDERAYRNASSLESGSQTEIGGDFGPVVVPDSHVFVLGDNRDVSHDSRSFGPVPLSLVRGQPWLVYWSAPEARTTSTWHATWISWRQAERAIRDLFARQRAARVPRVVR
jgi:signal peptidase I